MKDASMDSLMRKMVAARMRAPSQGCADENVMAAYLEGSLSPQETAAFEEHAAQCASCQETLALCIKLQVPEASVQSIEEQGDGKKVIFHFSIPIPVLGGVFAAFVLVAVLFWVVKDTQKGISPVQTAELQAPMKDAETANQIAPAPVTRQSTVAESPRLESRDTPLEKKKEPEFAVQKTEPQPNAAAIPTPAMAPAAPTVRADGPKVLEESSDEKIAGAAAAVEPAPAAAVAKQEKPPSAISSADAVHKVGTLAFNDAPQKSAELRAQRARSKEGEAESRQVGDKVFYRDSGRWIDRQCMAHPDDPIIEITSGDPEYKTLLARYPGLGKLLPALIYWEGKKYLLR